MEKQLKDSVQQRIDSRKVDLYNLSRDIWSQPELGGEEKYAHERLVHFFSQEQSWTGDRHYRLPTAFRASWGPVGGGEGSPVLNVAFLCEYDALPAIGHACGHNLIAETAVAAALGLTAALEQTELTFPVKVRLCVTTAEPECCSFLYNWNNSAVTFSRHPVVPLLIVQLKTHTDITNKLPTELNSSSITLFTEIT